MIGKMLKHFWTHLLITFYDNYTIEGFEKTNKKFELPTDLSNLDSATKRKMTICNLFANQNLSILEIVKVLDSSLHQVVPALIENELIKERRRSDRGAGPTKGDRNTLSILPEESKTASESAKPTEGINTVKGSSNEKIEGETDSHAFAEVVSTNRRMAS